jgi:hypothetical protein
MPRRPGDKGKIAGVPTLPKSILCDTTLRTEPKNTSKSEVGLFSLILAWRSAVKESNQFLEGPSMCSLKRQTNVGVPCRR